MEVMAGDPSGAGQRSIDKQSDSLKQTSDFGFIFPVFSDGLAAGRFMGGQAGRAVFPNRLEACFTIKKRYADCIGRDDCTPCPISGG